MIVTMPETASSSIDSHVDSDVAATSWMSLCASEMVSLRSQVAAAYPDTLGMSVLKQADEQCLLSLLALRRASHQERYRMRFYPSERDAKMQAHARGIFQEMCRTILESDARK